jgi:hypothetical protein
MRKEQLFSSSLRVLAVLVCFTIAALSFKTLVPLAVRHRLKAIDENFSFSSIEYGFNTIVINQLEMPGKGISAERASILFGGSPFYPVPSVVILEEVVFQPGSSQDSADPGSASGDLPVIHIVQGEIPSAGTQFFLTRLNGVDMGGAGGSWGQIMFNRCGDSFTVAFQECTAVPGMEDAIPELLRGHNISGWCSGIFAQSKSVNGFLTEIDGEPAWASFEYQMVNGVPEARFNIDFSQVAEPAMALLDSLSRGAIMTAVPAGYLSVVLCGRDSVFFDVQLLFDSVAVWSPQVAPDTFSAQVSLDCSGFFLPNPGLVVINSGIIGINQAEISFNLAYSFGERRKLYLVLSSPGLAGEAISASIPPAFLGRLSGLSLGGELCFSTELTLDWDYPDSCDIKFDIDASRLTVEYSPIAFESIRNGGGWKCLMKDSWGNSALIGIDAASNPAFVSFHSLPPCFEALLCCSEDATFRSHNGFSVFHIRNSLIANMEQGRFVRGGSTISMQLAKNMFLGREKTLARKLQEVFLTWRLESLLSKDRILEIYANIVELGPNVFGFNSAAMYYFNERVSDISVKETAFLVSILPGPRLYHRFGVQGELPEYWDDYLNSLISICGSRGLLSEAEVLQAVGDTLVFDGQVSWR